MTATRNKLVRGVGTTGAVGSARRAPICPAAKGIRRAPASALPVQEYRSSVAIVRVK